MDIMSGLSSNGSSRTEHMAYLVNELGLDQATAACLYRAEKLQEKGQLNLALVYFDKVLASNPDCVEAQQNARITRDILVEDKGSFTQKNGLESISEGKTASGTRNDYYKTAEMEVRWSGGDWADQAGYFHPADPAELAIDAAKSHLRKSGHEHSLIKLIKSQILQTECNHDTDYLKEIRGRAHFQVTLIPGLAPLGRERLFPDEAQPFERFASSKNPLPAYRGAATKKSNDSENDSMNTSSQFADADSTNQGGGEK